MAGIWRGWSDHADTWGKGAAGAKAWRGTCGQGKSKEARAIRGEKRCHLSGDRSLQCVRRMGVSVYSLRFVTIINGLKQQKFILEELWRRGSEITAVAGPCCRVAPSGNPGRGCPTQSPASGGGRMLGDAGSWTHHSILGLLRYTARSVCLCSNFSLSIKTLVILDYTCKDFTSKKVTCTGAWN